MFLALPVSHPIFLPGVVCPAMAAGMTKAQGQVEYLRTLTVMDWSLSHEVRVNVPGCGGWGLGRSEPSLLGQGGGGARRAGAGGAAHRLMR